jgi:hypothetical protein
MQRLRSLCLTIALTAAALAILVAPSSAIVLNNGLIVVHNNTKVPAKVEMLTMFGATWEGTTVAPGLTFTTERCCYAAGTKYRVYVHRLERIDADDRGYAGSTYFEPALCNRNGIPYGFAEFYIAADGVHRTSLACYQGPL